MDYKTSGVDIEAGREFVSEIKQAVEGTHTSNVIAVSYTHLTLPTTVDV